MTRASVSTLLDKFAISASAICAIHCLTLPLLVAVVPAISATFFGEERFHQMLLWIVIPMSAIALTLGCRQHKDRAVALLGVVGLLVLIGVGIWGHDVLGELGERIGTLVGSSAIAASHLRNYVLCRNAEHEHNPSCDRT